MSKKARTPPSGMTSRNADFFLSGSAIIIAATLLAYIPALRSGFVWDDAEHFGADRMSPTWQGLASIWTGHRFYYPLTSTSFWVLRRLFDLNPFPFHLVTAVVHAINSIFLWRICVKLRFPWAFVCGAVFALHPVHVQSVAWATELKNTQSGLFYLLSILAFIGYLENKRRHLFAFSLMAFLLAALSKTSTVVLPFVLVLIFGWNQRTVTGSALRLFLPYFVVAGVMGLMTVFLHRSQVSALNEWNENVFERVLLAGRGLWFYFHKLIWPFALCFVYPRWSMSENLGLWFSFPVLLSMIGGYVFIHRKRPAFRAIAFGLAGFFASLLPVLNFFKMFYARYSYAADHWQYLANMVAIPLLVALGSTLCRRVSVAAGMRTLGQAFLLGCLAVMTFAQCGDYANMETLWRQTLRKNPSAWIARVNLGILLAERGENEAAWRLYEAALDEKPGLAEAFLAMGNLRFHQARYEDAAEILRRGLEFSPDDLGLLNALAANLARLERFGEARELLERAIALDPSHAESHLNLGRILSAIGRHEEAVLAYVRAVNLDPGHSLARFQLAEEYLKLGRMEDALREYDFAFALNPGDADIGAALGALLGRLGRHEEALRVLQRAVEFSPEAAGLHFNLGVTLRKLGREAEADAAFIEAARRDPQFAR